MHIGTLHMLLRILVGAALGGAIGFERDLHGRPAGLRTHAIVALASATFMVVSTHFVYFQHYGAGDLVMVDPSRIAASVVSGIGFLGAGAILQTGITIRGLTTAAGLWLVAAIGMAAGGGMFAVAAFVTVIGLVALTLLRRLEDRGEPVYRQRVAVTVSDDAPVIEMVVEAMTLAGAVVSQQDYARVLADGLAHVTFELRTTKPLLAHEVGRAVERVAGVRQVKVESL